MDRLRVLVVLLLIVVIVESAVIVFPLVEAGGRQGELRPTGTPQTLTFGYSVFNQPISNDTDAMLSRNYSGSWQLTVRSMLTFGRVSTATESQVALAPVYGNESLSIPALIVQERSDGLIRIEYFAQNWPHTYGLVLYNSTAPGWTQGTNVTLRFSSFGPPAEVNPEIAPRPNGNLTILIGNQAVVSDFMIAWAPLGELYLYGLAGSEFTGGTLSVTVQGLSRG